MIKPQSKTGWCFATINGRLAEVYFHIGKGVRDIHGHCYVDRKEFTKREHRMIDSDVKKYILTYRNKRYLQK